MQKRLLLLNVLLSPPTGPIDSKSRPRPKLVLISPDKRLRRTLLEVVGPRAKTCRAQLGAVDPTGLQAQTTGHMQAQRAAAARERMQVQESQWTADRLVKLIFPTHMQGKARTHLDEEAQRKAPAREVHAALMQQAAQLVNTVSPTCIQAQIATMFRTLHMHMPVQNVYSPMQGHQVASMYPQQIVGDFYQQQM